MFNIGFTELIILGVIGLLVLGPEQLPEVARKMAKIFNELKRAKDEIIAPVDEFKAEAQRMLERARESAAQKELDELLHRNLDPHLGDREPVPPNDPPPPPSVKPDLPAQASSEPLTDPTKKNV